MCVIIDIGLYGAAEPLTSFCYDDVMMTATTKLRLCIRYTCEKLTRCPSKKLPESSRNYTRCNTIGILKLLENKQVVLN